MCAGITGASKRKRTAANHRAATSRETTGEARSRGVRAPPQEQPLNHQRQTQRKQFLSCFPRDQLPGRHHATEFSLRTANNATIRTYGYTTLRLDIAPRRAFVWHFIIADVAIPIIGADFLSHFSLLPDYRRGLMVDGRTGEEFTAARVDARQHSVKVLETSSRIPGPVPGAHPTGRAAPTVRHSTEHHIRTTPGPPVFSRTRRLAPERL